MAAVAADRELLWGLAKVVGRGEAASKEGAAEATLQPGSGSGSSETLPGTALGTPAYMSPEQAAGRLDQVGPLSDVYSLGATLYCLLTGRPPLGETDVGEALRRVQRGAFPPPRAVRPGIPQGLEAICRKAMALNPGERYPGPRALADEVEHWLADEPVSAYRDPLATRLTRWGRRHRTAAVGIGMLLVTAVAALAISTVLIGSEQSRTHQQFNRAEANLAVAKQQRQRADDKAREASQRAKSLRRKDYINRVNQAHGEVLDDNIERAEDLLEGCPSDLRGWEWHYVRRLSHLERLTYRGHFENVRCLAISPDGKWVASGSGFPWDQSLESDRGEVRLWDCETGQERYVFGDVQGTVQAVAISPDGKFVAAGGGFYAPRPEGWLKAWNATSGKLVWGRTVPETTVMSLAFHPGTQSLAVGYGRYSDLNHVGYVQLHRPIDGAPIGDAIGKLVGGVNTVAFDGEGRRLAMTGLERIEIRDVETRALVRPLTGHTRWVYCVAFSPDGKRLASGGWDNTIKLWDLTAGVPVGTIQGHRGFVEEIAFSPDGQRLASVGEDKGVRLWDPATGRELAAFHGHTHFVHGLAFHPDGRRILSGGLDGTVKVWDAVRSRPIVFGNPGFVHSLEFREDGRHVVSKSGYSFASMTTKDWNLDTGEEDRAGPPPERDSSRHPTDAEAPGRSSSRRSPDGSLLAEVQGFEDRDVTVRQTASGTVAFTLKGHTWSIFDVVFSPDGTRLATASSDRTIKLWDAATGQEALTLRGHTAGVQCVAFSPDGRMLASGGIDNLVFLWDATPLPEAVFTEAKAHRLVQSRLAEWPGKSDLVAQLCADPGLDESTRIAALRIAGQLTDQPQLRRLQDASWRIVRSPGRDAQDYRRALRWAEEGLRLGPAPEGWTLIVLGVASYRAGRFQDARDALDRAEPLLKGISRTFGSVSHVFQAMTLFHLGRRDEARSELGRLRQRFRETPWEFNRARTLLREAEELIDPQPAGPATGPRSGPPG